MHPEQQAFLNAIIANRKDDLPRLVYADWLEDPDRCGDLYDPERAEFIRLHCQINQGDNSQELKTRVTELARKNRAWLPPSLLPKVSYFELENAIFPTGKSLENKLLSGLYGVLFKRGFIEGISTPLIQYWRRDRCGSCRSDLSGPCHFCCSLESLASVTEDIFRCNPVWYGMTLDKFPHLDETHECWIWTFTNYAFLDRTEQLPMVMHWFMSRMKTYQAIGREWIGYKSREDAINSLRLALPSLLGSRIRPLAHRQREVGPQI